MTVTVDLKPCPFCGSYVQSRSILKMPIHLFKCNGCGAVVSFDNPDCNKYPDKAIEYYNRRTS